MSELHILSRKDPASRDERMPGDGKAVQEAGMIHGSIPENATKTLETVFRVILRNQAFRAYPDKIMGNHL